MAVGNVGAVMNLIQGFAASEFAATRSNQGLSIFAEMVLRIASRAELTEANLRVTAPVLFDGTNDVDVESGAVRLIGLVVDNTEAADNVIVIYETNTVTEGTTDPKLILEIPASSMQTMILPSTLPLDALSWSALDAGTVAIEAGTLAAANSLKVMLVYAE